MQNHSLSLRLKPDVQARLQAEAEASEQKMADLAVTAIENYLEGQAEKRLQLEQAVAAADDGTFISSERMADWISSWGSQNERPEPEPDIFPKPSKRA
jgi:predicted transcriptional regulator